MFKNRTQNSLSATTISNMQEIQSQV